MSVPPSLDFDVVLSPHVAVDIPHEIDAARQWLAGMPAFAEFALIGSASYLPEQAQDVDFAVLLAPSINACSWADAWVLAAPEWRSCGEYDTNQGNWCSVRCGYLNLMLTSDRKFYEGYKLATEVCKVLQLENKDDRIAVCKVVRDGLLASEVRP